MIISELIFKLEEIKARKGNVVVEIQPHLTEIVAFNGRKVNELLEELNLMKSDLEIGVQHVTEIKVIYVHRKSSSELSFIDRLCSSADAMGGL